MDKQPSFDVNFEVQNERFKTTTKEQRDNILIESKPKNTRKSTDLWMNCFKKYLQKKNYPEADDIGNEQLPSILESFYCEVEKSACKTGEKLDENAEKTYKNTTMRTIRAAIARYYRDSRSIDIITNEAFVRSNQIFKGVQKINKKKGYGKIDSKTPITDLDMEKITSYFLLHIIGPPNPRKLQEVILFNVLYYLCRRGRENLRPMKKTTFMIEYDESCHRRYIYQAEDELDKNHQEDTTQIANQGRIYEQPGTEVKLDLLKLFYAATAILLQMQVNTTLELKNIIFFQVLTYVPSSCLNCMCLNSTQREMICGKNQRKKYRLPILFGLTTYQWARIH